MEYFEYGDLGDHLGQPLPEKEAQQITGQILCGLDHMHSNGFTHRDLKPKNIFVVSKAPEWWVKIGDFGVSKRVEGSTVLQTHVGTPYYIAPEILQEIARFGDMTDLGYTSAVDMWSLGVIVCHLLTGQGPSRKNKDLLAYLGNPAKPPSKALFSDGIGRETFGFLEGLLVSKPEKRLSAKDALQHGWLKKSARLSANYPDRSPSVRHSSTPESEGHSEASTERSPGETVLRSTVPIYQSSDEAAGYDTYISQSSNPSHTTNSTNQGSQEESVPPTETTALRTTGPPNEDPGIESPVTLRTIKATDRPGPFPYEKNDYKTIERQFRQATEEGENAQGDDNEETLRSMYWLGQSLYEQKKYHEAEKRFQQVVRGEEKIHGSGHQETLLSIHWLGQSLYEQKKYHEAEMRFRQAVRGREKIDGSDHPDTLRSIHRLGHCLFQQKKYREAEMRYQQVVSAEEKTYVSDHQQTLDSIYWLGRCSFEQGYYKEAEMKLQQAASRTKTILGDARAFEYMYWLGRCLFKQSKYQEAGMEFQGAAKGLEASLGSDHSKTLTALSWARESDFKRTIQFTLDRSLAHS